MAVGDAHVFPGFLAPVLSQISFPSHRLLFPHASAEMRGEYMPERNFASTGSQTHNNQAMSPTSSPLSLQDGAIPARRRFFNAQKFIYVQFSAQKFLDSGGNVMSIIMQKD